MKNSFKFKTIFQNKKIEIVVLFYILVLFSTGLSMQSLNELGVGLKEIFTASGVLISDYMVIGGIGAAFVNAAGVAFIGYILLIANKVIFTGISIAAIFTMMGFALMGKTIWSVLPIIFGVYIYSKLTGREFVTNIYPALFGTALAPLVTEAAFGFEWGILGGVVVGMIVGLVIAPIANHSLAFHEGYNLYNVGFSAGFIGLIFMNIFRAYGYETESYLIWGTEFDEFLRPFSILLFISMAVFGVIIDQNNGSKYKKVLKLTGVTVTDFVDLTGIGNTLINMGTVGMLGVGFIEFVDGSYNGPTLSGLLTMVGFAGFGKQPMNILPVMVGVWLGSLFSIYEVNAPGTVLAGLFGTTLAPLAGKFGPVVGVLAGATHLYVVSTLGFIHGGLNLYNNGFSGGFVSAFFVAIMKGIKKDEAPHKMMKQDE